MSRMGRRDFLQGTIALSAAAGALPLSGALEAETRGPADSVVVKTHEGALRGLETDRLQIFKGIRYGEPTGGKMRFRPPVAARPWKGIRDALTLGSPCYQTNIDTAPWVDPMPESEDCLVLNVWRPKGGENLPVMVWIHGGGYWWGSGGCPIYDGSAIAERGDVVVVSLNHRLNSFGYLYLGGLSEAFADSANLGQRDLVLALQWVRRNIASFGGNPEAVTIFGESGGGGKVSTLLAMPSARGLFQRAIVQSGSVLRFRTKETATEEARAALRHIGLAERDAARLRDAPPKQLLAAYNGLMVENHVGVLDDVMMAPVIDDATLPHDAATPEGRALSKDVPLLVGTTEEEVIWLLSLSGKLPAPATDAEAAAIVQKTFSTVGSERAHALVEAYRKRFPYKTPQRLAVAIASGIWMGANAIRQASFKASDAGAPCFTYSFGWKEPFMDGLWAIHGGDVPFVFDKIDMPKLLSDDDAPGARAAIDSEGRRYVLRDGMMDAWISFARDGKPSSPSLPQWPAYTVETRATMRLDGHSCVDFDPLGPEVRAALGAT